MSGNVLAHKGPTHRCWCLECMVKVPDEKLLCKGHWAMLNSTLQHELVATMDTSKPIHEQPQDFLSALTLAVTTIATREGRYPDPEEEEVI